MKDLLRRLKHWYECDRPASIGYWILDMDADHRWFGPLVSVLSSLVGWGIGLWLFSLILSMLQR